MVFWRVDVLFTVCLILIYYLSWKHYYWMKRGVRSLKPKSIFGNTKELALGRSSLGDQFAELYRKIKARQWAYAGVFSFYEPIFMPTDLNLVKNIMLNSFDHFRNHGMYVNEEADPLTGHLFNLEDEKWRFLRTKLTPAFTSGKMKMMFPIIEQISTNLANQLAALSAKEEAIDIRDLFSRFTTDVIGSVAFGIDCNSLENPSSELRTFGKRVFQMDYTRIIKSTIISLVPRKILVCLGFREISKDIEDFFKKLVQDTIHHRESKGITRMDFLQMMMQLRSRGEVPEREEHIVPTSRSRKEFLSFNELVAQCFMFFVAGFETSASAMTFTVLELARNQEVQVKLREEIEGAIAENGELTYAAIQQMGYLDRVVKEALRMHPPIPMMPRVCNKEFRLPDSSVVLEAGTKVHLSFQGIHMDPEHYPRPERFDPDRFLPENEARRHPYAYLPFGEGPRMCIGSRFGVLEVKIALVAIVRCYEIVLDGKTQVPIKYASNSFIASVEKGVWIRARPLR